MNTEELQQRITGISHSGFYARDLDKTVEFYTKVLGAKLAWRNDGSKTPLMKLYIGEFGLSILKRMPDTPEIEIPHAIHWSYRVDWRHCEEVVKYIRSCGVEIEGPVAHKREPGLLNWFFLDPDGYRLEVEARFPDPKEADKVFARNQTTRNEHMGLYAGDKVLHKTKI